jgi:hypothetical protein
VSGEPPAHPFRILLPEPCAAFDVREEKRDRPLGECDGVVPSGDGGSRKQGVRLGAARLGRRGDLRQVRLIRPVAPSPRRPVGLRPRLGANRLEERLRFRVGLRVQLAVQPQTQLAVREDGGAIVAPRRQSPHQRPLATLPQGLRRHSQPQPSPRARRIPSRQRPLRQPLQRPQIRLLPCLALLERPLLHAAFQQGSAVERQRLLQRCIVPARDRPVEGDDVHFRLRQIQRQRPSRGRTQPLRPGAHRGAQVREALPQAGQHLGLVALGPEGGREPLALDLAAVAQRKERQNPEALTGAETRQREAVDAYFDRAEEADGQRRDRRTG